MAKVGALLIARSCGLVLLLLPLVARADTLLYDNGADLQIFSPLDSINSHHQVTDDFTLSSAATLERVVFGEATLLVGTGAQPVPATVDWCIGAAQFSTSVGCGTGTISATASGVIQVSLTNFSSSFLLPSLSVGPGTYWLTLGSGTDSGLGNTYWSVAALSGNAQILGFAPAPPGVQDLGNAPSFQIYGTSVPEPDALLLVGLALASSFAVRLSASCSSPAT